MADAWGAGGGRLLYVLLTLKKVGSSLQGSIVLTG